MTAWGGSRDSRGGGTDPLPELHLLPLLLFLQLLHAGCLLWGRSQGLGAGPQLEGVATRRGAGLHALGSGGGVGMWAWLRLERGVASRVGAGLRCVVGPRDWRGVVEGAGLCGLWAWPPHLGVSIEGAWPEGPPVPRKGPGGVAWNQGARPLADGNSQWAGRRERGVAAGAGGSGSSGGAPATMTPRPSVTPRFSLLPPPPPPCSAPPPRRSPVPLTPRPSRFSLRSRRRPLHGAEDGTEQVELRHLGDAGLRRKGVVRNCVVTSARRRLWAWPRSAKGAWLCAKGRSNS